LENTLSVSCFTGDDSFHIFEKDNCWFALPDPFEDVGEEVARVFC
jgi:hypothetical protein